jgi:3D (Asp-Asp-Asp) domain-containing protein
MTRRIVPDRGAGRWMTALLVLGMMTTMAAALPSRAEAQRRPRVLGTPAPQPPRDTIALRPAAAPAEDGLVPPETEAPRPVPLPAEMEGAAAVPVSRRVQMRSTAYCLRGTMRTGVRVRDGMAAGDPSVLPLGSVIRVSHTDGRPIGVFVIMDTGGAVRGNKIDLWFDSCREASDWGTRPVVVEVLDIGRV